MDLFVRTSHQIHTTRFLGLYLAGAIVHMAAHSFIDSSSCKTSATFICVAMSS